MAQVPGKYELQQGMIQKAREHELIREKLVREIQKKEILLHSIVHDLTGPLTSMRGCMEMIAQENITPQDTRHLAEMGMRVAEDQEIMIREILNAFSSDLNTVDASELDAESAPDAHECAKEVVASFVPPFALRNVELRLAAEESDDDRHRWKVVGEKSHFVRILSNLVENALRHSPPNSAVTLALEHVGNGVMIYVDDEGPGVPQELSGTLFHSLVRGTGKSGKSGFGLYFCRITVEQWGGEIGVQPRAEKGSRFWLRLQRPPRL